MRALALLLLAAPAFAGERAVFHTPLGVLVFELDRANAPRHAEQFRNLVHFGAYDTAPIYRVMPGYLVQVASVRDRRVPLDADQLRYVRRLPAEFRAPHRRGSLTMSRKPDDPHSGESSFSILLRDAPHLDGKYTVFGRLVEGWETLDALAALPLLEDKRPEHWIEITRAELMSEEDASRAVGAFKPAKGGASAGNNRALAFVFGAIVALGAASGALFKVRPRAARSCAVLSALLGLFGAFLAAMPGLPRKSPIGIALFLCALAVFKLMSQFEQPQSGS